MKRVTAIGVWVLLNAFAINPVAAADFTLKVPVHIQNLEEHIFHVKVWCRIYGKYLDGHYDQVGFGLREATLDSNTGNADAELEFPIDISRNIADPRDVDKYECYLALFSNDPGTPLGGWEIENCGDKVPVHVGGAGGSQIRISVADQTKPCQVRVQGSFTGQ